MSVELPVSIDLHAFVFMLQLRQKFLQGGKLSVGEFVLTDKTDPDAFPVLPETVGSGFIHGPAWTDCTIEGLQVGPTIQLAVQDDKVISAALEWGWLPGLMPMIDNLLRSPCACGAEDYCHFFCIHYLSTSTS